MVVVLCTDCAAETKIRDIALITIRRINQVLLAQRITEGLVVIDCTYLRAMGQRWIAQTGFGADVMPGIFNTKVTAKIILSVLSTKIIITIIMVRLRGAQV